MQKMNRQNATCTLQLCRNEQKMNAESFKVAVTRAVDESLSSFNSLDKEAVYLHLEKAYGIRKQNIHSDIEALTNAIENMFGTEAKLLEIRIIEKLHETIPDFTFYPKTTTLDFKDYLASLRVFLLQIS